MPRTRVPPGLMVFEVLSGTAPLRELKPGNRSVFDRVDIEDQTKPEYPVITVDPSPAAATVIELFREYKVRIAEDNFSALTGKVHPGTISGRARQKKGMTYFSFTAWMYKARRVGLIHAIEELPLERAGMPPGRLGNPGGLLTVRLDPFGVPIAVRSRRVLYELTPDGHNSANWTDVGGSYSDLVHQKANERKPEDIPVALENEFVGTIGTRLETVGERVPIRQDLISGRARIQRPTGQTTTAAGGGVPSAPQEPPEEIEEQELEPVVSAPALDKPTIPNFDLGERPEKRSVGLLIGHLGKLVDIGIGFPDVQVEIEDLTEQVEEWLNQIAEELAEEQGKPVPNSARVKELTERFDAISQTIVDLREFDPRGAIETLRGGFGLV